MDNHIVGFRFNPDETGETQDKLEFLAREEGAGEITFTTDTKIGSLGSAEFSREKDADSFAKKARSFAGVNTILLEGNVTSRSF